MGGFYKKSTWLLTFLIAALLFSGCTSPTPLGVLPTNTETITPLPTKQPAQSHPPTVTTIPPTPTYFTYKRDCLSIVPILEMTDMIGGLILSEAIPNEQRENVVLMNLSNNTIMRMFGENDKVNGIRVSPNNTWITYALITSDQTAETYKLAFRNMVTSDIVEIPWDDSWSLSGIIGWNNQQDILIEMNAQDTNSVVRLNLFTREASSIPIIFPNQVVKGQHRNLFLAKYNPSFDYVIYPSSLAGEDGYLLINTITSEKISFIPSPTLVTFSSPTWNYSGNKFLVSQKTLSENYTFELVYGTVTGEITQITNLSNVIDAFYISDIIWSPNDNYVALVINEVTDINNQLQRLLILDMVNKEILDFCININYLNWQGEFLDNNSPVWSPDGKMLVAEEQFDFGENKLIFINLSKMKVAIMEDKKILGWVNLVK